MEEDGALIRLYPVPFRLIGDNKQFKKWQWITVRVEKAKNDHRPESHKVFVDTIDCDPDPLSTRDRWRERRECIQQVPIFNDFSELAAKRINPGTTLGLLRPSRVVGLDITPADKPVWTDEEMAKLIQLQELADLFDETDAGCLTTLKKVPFDFHYRYVCEADGGVQEYRHKIVDWEIGALYWNVQRSHGLNWETPFRAKLEQDLPCRDLIFLMGTIHRFPDQWLIVSLIYPPKLPSEPPRQGSLFYP